MGLLNIHKNAEQNFYMDLFMVSVVTEHLKMNSLVTMEHLNSCSVFELKNVSHRRYLLYFSEIHFSEFFGELRILDG